MIVKFNLAPEKEPQDGVINRSSHKSLKILSAILLILISGIIVLTVKTERELRALERQKREKNELLLKYKTIANKIKDLEKRNEEIERKIRIIVALKEKQDLTLKRMSTLFTYAEKKRVYFTNFQMNETQARVRGISFDIDLVANYMDLIETNRNIIKSINLKFAKTKEFISYYNFEIEVVFQ